MQHRKRNPPPDPELEAHFLERTDQPVVGRGLVAQLVGQIGNIQTLVDPNAMGMTMYLGQLREGVTPPFTAVFDNATWTVD